MNLKEKIKIVESELAGKKVAIGFSGGADSTFIAYLASKVSSDVLAITIDNHLMPTDFIAHTKNMAELFKINHEIVDIDFYEDAEFLLNKPSRCYSCRNLMYEQIRKVAHERGFDYVCDGNNISDLVVDRPGILITYKNKFETPLITAKLTSKDIHEYLDENGIPYSRSTTCLATRIPTNTKTTKRKIERISFCEDYILANTNCEIVKVRDFEEIGMCEVDKIEEIINDNKFKQINDALKSKGFKKVTLNLTPLDDNEFIDIDFENDSFEYRLPFTINLEDTAKQLSQIISEYGEKIEIENFTIYEKGLIKGIDFKNKKEALNSFMELLPKLRRNV